MVLQRTAPVLARVLHSRAPGLGWGCAATRWLLPRRLGSPQRPQKAALDAALGWVCMPSAKLQVTTTEVAKIADNYKLGGRVTHSGWVKPGLPQYRSVCQQHGTTKCKVQLAALVAAACQLQYCHSGHCHEPQYSTPAKPIVIWTILELAS